MTLIEMMMKRPLWQGAGEGAGAGAGEGEGAGAGEGEGAGAGAGEGEGAGAGAGEGAGGKSWWEADTISAEQRDYLTRHGLTKPDAAEIVPQLIDWHTNAEKKLGKPADTLMTKPTEGQSRAEWMRENAEIFGLPDKVEDYEIKRPDMPEGMEYDEGLEGDIKTIAFEEGVPPAAVERMVAKYAERMAGTVTGLNDELTASKTEMMADLTKEWGAETPAKMAMARQGMSALAEVAGFDQAAIVNLTGAMKENVGDAAIIRMGAALAEMLSEDQLKGLGKGNTNLGTTPAEARQKAAHMRSSEGEYGKAMAAGDQAKMKELRGELGRLDKLAAAK